jgi:hypothetical protein
MDTACLLYRDGQESLRYRSDWEILTRCDLQSQLKQLASTGALSVRSVERATPRRGGVPQKKGEYWEIHRTNRCSCLCPGLSTMSEQRHPASRALGLQ